MVERLPYTQNVVGSNPAPPTKIMFNNVNQWSESARHLLVSFPRGSSVTFPTTHSCQVPHRSLVVDLNGDCFLCECDAWLPVTVGKITDFATLGEVWNSATAKEIQTDIDQKKYTHCAVKHCGILEKDIVRPRFTVSINIDESCNLQCPTCRSSSIFHKSGEVYNRKLAQVQHLVTLINEFPHPLDIVVSGNGDPLASLIMRPLIINWKPKPNQKMKLFTNGLLLKKLLANSSILSSIDNYRISVDAGSPEVYSVVRFPGNFSVLRENLSWLSENKLSTAQVSLLCCVSSMNVHDIKNFAQLCTEYGFIGTLTKVNDWHTLNNFNEFNVADNPDHPLYSALVDQLTEVSKLPNIFLGSCLSNLVRH